MCLQECCLPISSLWMMIHKISIWLISRVAEGHSINLVSLKSIFRLKWTIVSFPWYERTLPCNNILFSIRLPENGQNYSKSFTTILTIYVDIIINFEGTYYFTASTSSLKHYSIYLDSILPYSLFIFLNNPNFRPTIGSIQYIFTFISKTYCWEIIFLCTSSHKLHVSLPYLPS